MRVTIEQCRRCERERSNPGFNVPLASQMAIKPGLLRSRSQRRAMKAIFLLIAVCGFQNVLAAEWGYTPKDGPTQWGKLGYSLCATGKQQSPVDITKVMAATAKPLVFHYQTTGFNRRKDSHNMYADAQTPSAAVIELDNKTYQLQSLHFHTPSEHEVLGVQYPLEGHFIHADAAGNTVVVGVFFKLGTANPALQQFLSQPRQKQMTLDLNQFLPEQKRYYTYAGSLTTPPCTEGLTWVVLARPMTLSLKQLRLFKSRVIFFNSRPPQPLAGRVIYKVEK